MHTVDTKNTCKIGNGNLTVFVLAMKLVMQSSGYLEEASQGFVSIIFGRKWLFLLSLILNYIGLAHLFLQTNLQERVTEEENSMRISSHIPPTIPSSWKGLSPCRGHLSQNWWIPKNPYRYWGNWSSGIFAQMPLTRKSRKGRESPRQNK